MVYAVVSKTTSRKAVWVRLPPPAHSAWCPNDQKQNYMLKKILIGVGVFLTLFLTLGIIYMYWFDAYERFEGGLGADLVEYTAQYIYKHKVQHGTLPKSLAEAGAEDTICHWSYGCAHIKYSIGLDGKSIYLAAARDKNSWVGWFFSDMKPESISSDGRLAGSFGIAQHEGYTGKNRGDWPIYRETTPIFTTPSAWPKF